MSARTAWLAPLLLSLGAAAAPQSTVTPSDNITAVKPADAFAPVAPADNVRPIGKPSEGVISGVKPANNTSASPAVEMTGTRVLPPAPPKPKGTPAAEATPAEPVSADDAPAEPAAAPPRLASVPGPGGPPVTTGENHLTLRGTIASVERGKSVTVTLRSGRTLTYELAPGAAVPPKLAPGSPVRIRVLLAAAGRVTDRVEADVASAR